VGDYKCKISNGIEAQDKDVQLVVVDSARTPTIQARIINNTLKDDASGNATLEITQTNVDV
jgi:hypothetical protein